MYIYGSLFSFFSPLFSFTLHTLLPFTSTLHAFHSSLTKSHTTPYTHPLTLAPHQTCSWSNTTTRLIITNAIILHTSLTSLSTPVLVIFAPARSSLHLDAYPPYAWASLGRSKALGRSRKKRRKRRNKMEPKCELRGFIYHFKEWTLNLCNTLPTRDKDIL